MYINNNDSNEKALIIGVNIGNYFFNNEIEELKELAKACNIETTHIITQNLEKIDTTFYVGTGKVDEIKEYIRDENIDLIIFNDELTPSQIRNLQNKLDIFILDRTSLIIEIFARRAKTKEAKLQVEVAKLKYMLPRLVGMRTSLGRQGGGSGFSNRGSGEKKIELDRRKISDRITELEKELKLIEKERDIQRRKREESSLPLISLVGYTNSGKSTILNTFIDEYVKDDEKKVFQQDMLFATLDTQVRKIVLKDKRSFLLSDTVGFVNKLPHGLVKAFRSTLEEVKKADLLIHVVDYSNEEYLNHIEVTNNTLKEIGAENIPIIYAYNKAELRDIKIPRVEDNKVYISALNKIGIDELIELISKSVFSNFIKCDILIPFDKGEIVSYLNKNAIIENTEYIESGTKLTLSLNEKDYNKLKEYIINEYK